MLKRRICVVSGARADYGLLCNLMKAIDKDEDFELKIIATGMHLSSEFGFTYKEIIDDGFSISRKVEMLLSGDSVSGVTKSIGLGVIGFADVLQELKPDLLVLPGDRFEMLAAAQAALIAKIPVAHIAGGDTTEGAFDEAIRHSITKMAHLHFVTNDKSYKRVKQLGENPQYIYNVGSPSIDRIKNMKPIEREQLEDMLRYKFQKKNLLITFHPVSLDEKSSGEQFCEVLKAIYNLGSDVGCIFTKPNADPEGRQISEILDSFVQSHPCSIACKSLGELYLSVINEVDVVVGNSSSGIYEVPYFKKPTVD